MSSQTEFITVGVKRFRGAEMLPAILSANGFHVTHFLSNMECDVNIRKKLFAECRVVSGTSTFQEAFERMTKELTASASSAMKIKVVAPPD